MTTEAKRRIARPTLETAERNLKMFKQLRDGISDEDLAEMTGLTTRRISQITDQGEEHWAEMLSIAEERGIEQIGLTPDSDESVVMIPTDKLMASPYQPRTHIDPDEVRRRALDIRARGLLQPIVVTPIEEGVQIFRDERTYTHGDYIIIFGHIRVESYRLLASGDLPAEDGDARPLTYWQRIPAIVRPYTGVADMALMALSENVQRAQLRWGEETRAMRTAIDTAGVTQRQLATMMGISENEVSNRLRVLRLPDGFIDLIDDGNLSYALARDHLLQYTGRTHTHDIELQQILRFLDERKNSDGKRRFTKPTLDFAKQTVWSDISAQQLTRWRLVAPDDNRTTIIIDRKTNEGEFKPTFDIEAFKSEIGREFIHRLPDSYGDKAEFTCKADLWDEWQDAARPKAGYASADEYPDSLASMIQAGTVEMDDVRRFIDPLIECLMKDHTDDIENVVNGYHGLRDRLKAGHRKITSEDFEKALWPVMCDGRRWGCLGGPEHQHAAGCSMPIFDVVAFVEENPASIHYVKEHPTATNSDERPIIPVTCDLDLWEQWQDAAQSELDTQQDETLASVQQAENFSREKSELPPKLIAQDGHGSCFGYAACACCRGWHRHNALRCAEKEEHPDRYTCSPDHTGDIDEQMLLGEPGLSPTAIRKARILAGSASGLFIEAYPRAAYLPTQLHDLLDDRKIDNYIMRKMLTFLHVAGRPDYHAELLSRIADHLTDLAYSIDGMMTPQMAGNGIRLVIQDMPDAERLRPLDDKLVSFGFESPKFDVDRFMRDSANDDFHRVHTANGEALMTCAIEAWDDAQAAAITNLKARVARGSATSDEQQTAQLQDLSMVDVPQEDEKPDFREVSNCMYGLDKPVFPHWHVEYPATRRIWMNQSKAAETFEDAKALLQSLDEPSKARIVVHLCDERMWLVDG